MNKSFVKQSHVVRLLAGQSVELLPNGTDVPLADSEGYIARHAHPNRRERKRLANIWQRGRWEGRESIVGKVRKGPRGSVPVCR